MTNPIYIQLLSLYLNIDIDKNQVIFHLTCYLAAIDFKSHRDASFPGHRFDSDKSSDQGFGKNSNHYICGVGVSMKDLDGRRKSPLNNRHFRLKTNAKIFSQVLVKLFTISSLFTMVEVVLITCHVI